MKEVYITKSFDKPDKFYDLGSGYWYYNYNIQEEYISTDDIPMIVYSYVQIRLNEKPTYNKCVESVIRQYVTVSQEFDLINTANKALINKQEISQEYKDYLFLLEEIKSKVKNDFIA